MGNGIFVSSCVQNIFVSSCVQNINKAGTGLQIVCTCTEAQIICTCHVICVCGTKVCTPVVPQYNIGKGNGISLCYIFYNSLHVCIEMCEWCVCSKIESGVARFHMRRPGCQHCCCHTGVPTMYSPVRRSLNAKLMAMFFFSSFFQPFFQPRTTKSKAHRHPWAWDSSHLHQNHRCCCSPRRSADWRCRHRHHHPLSIESK